MSRGEQTLSWHLRLYKVAGWTEQYPWAAPERKYRFDFAFPTIMLAVEVEGGVHGIKRQYQLDVERHNLALVLGWRVLRFTPRDVEEGKAIDTIRAFLAGDLDKAKEVIQRRDGRPRTLRDSRVAEVAEVDRVPRAAGRRKPPARENV